MEGGGGNVDRGAILEQTELTDIRKQQGQNMKRKNASFTAGTHQQLFMIVIHFCYVNICRFLKKCFNFIST